MRLLLGSVVALALLLGLACCVKPISSYEDNNNVNPQQDDIAPEKVSVAINGDVDAANVEPDSGKEKRDQLGMPRTNETAAIVSDVNSPPGSQLRPPANDPLNRGDIGGNVEQTVTLQPSEEVDQKVMVAPPASTGRSFMADAFQTLTNVGQAINQAGKSLDTLQTNPAQQQQQQQQQQQLPPQQQQQQQQSQQQQQQQVPIQQIGSPDSQVKPEDLPKIIENNKQVSLQEQQENEQKKHQEHSLVGSNSTITSSARTFDSWTNCVGSSTSKYGTCKNDVECNKSKGRAEGSCMGGFGVCCVMALTCGEKSLENNTFFANPDHPEPSWEARLCEVEVKKKHSHILQVMIEFEDFELAPPNANGECVTDVFQVKLASHRPSPYSLLRICGQNTGQHLYLDVSQLEEPIVLSVATSGGGFPRRWSIRIVQMDEKNYLLAPPGCLQYYTDTVGHFRSFNMGKNLRNLYYAICFRIDNGYSGIRFTENFFGMNGPFCRRKPGGPGGRYNGSIEAHPHHLVIPPPGYARPPPGPNKLGGPRSLPLRGPGGLGGRFKRYAYLEPLERPQRTLHEHEKEDKDYKLKGGYGPHSPPGYGPPPPPGYSGYGPPLPYSGYGGEYKEGEYKEKGHEHESKGWLESLGWSSSSKKEENKHESKYGAHYPSTYAPHYGGPPGAYGPGPHKIGGPPGYGGPPPGPYGPPGYGEYHHKEIDKFGKKYEHLEYKHEQNHHSKHEHEHEKTSSSWWPSWGSSGSGKEKTKEEKYFQHHEALFPLIRMPEMPHCEPRFCGTNDVITFPPSGDSISEMCGNRFNRGRGPKIISGSPLVVYVSNRGHNRGGGFDINYEQVFYIPRAY